MDCATALLVVATIGVSFGWQPSQQDPQAYEVLMQVEPELLDVLQDGRQVPIESHVPASVAPIRNVRIVVGYGELPRTPIAKAGDSQRIVRGQRDTLREHTAQFQGDNGWGGQRYPIGDQSSTDNSRRYEQRGATIGNVPGSEPIRTAQNPWPLDRVQTAVTETGGALRDAVEAGIQQATDELGLSRGSSGQAPSAWPAPPPPATTPGNAAAPAPTSAGWTSIRSDLAPPRLNLPPLSSTAGTRVSAPNTTTTSSQQNWADSWGAAASTSPATPARSTNTSLGSGGNMPGQGPLFPAIGSATTRPTTTSPPAGDRYAQSSTRSNTGADLWANFGNSPAISAHAPPTTAANGALSDRYETQPPAQNNTSQPLRDSPTGPTTQAATQPADNNQPQISFANPSNQASQPTPATQLHQSNAPPEEVPWKPLLAVSLALAGSLGANLFLGFSYAGARLRYRALVRKTTDAFQKATGIAA